MKRVCVWVRRRKLGQAACSFFKSEFKTLKTPPSHGFWGFAAIKPVAESWRDGRWFWGCSAKEAPSRADIEPVLFTHQKIEMKEFKKTLKAMGFKRVTPSVFYFDNNGIFYVVSFKSDGSGEPKVGLEISHAGMFDSGVPRARCSPVGGWVGSLGVGLSSYFDGKPSHVLLEKAVRGFFSYFKSASDWQVALQTLKEKELWPEYEAIPMREDAGSMDVSWFVNQVPNELKTRNDILETVRELFVSQLGTYGFYQEDEFLYIRKRNGIYDCIHFYHDEVYTFFRVKVYIWSDRFECNDWSSFSEFIDYFVPVRGWVRTSDFVNNQSVFDDLLKEVSEFVMQFKNEKDYIDYVGEHLNWFTEPRYQKIKSMIE